MRCVRIHQVDAFTTRTLEGNPAGVVLDAAGLSEREMQAIAREMNVSETAFVLPPEGPDHELRIRFFTPTREVPSCGHATIAAHYVRAHALGLPETRVWQRIGIGVLPVDVAREDGDYKIFMVQGRPEITPPLARERADAVLAALGLGAGDRDERCPVQIVSTGHSKVLVGVRSRRILDGIEPDRAALVRMSGELACNGYFVFTLDGDVPGVLVHARMFAPAIGIAEDPVTGNGNGPLGVYLAVHGLAPAAGDRLRFRARQGEALGRVGHADVEVTLEDGVPAGVRVGGRAVVAFETELTLDDALVPR